MSWPLKKLAARNATAWRGNRNVSAGLAAAVQSEVPVATSRPSLIAIGATDSSHVRSNNSYNMHKKQSPTFLVVNQTKDSCQLHTEHFATGHPHSPHSEHGSPQPALSYMHAPALICVLSTFGSIGWLSRALPLGLSMWGTITRVNE